MRGFCINFARGVLNITKILRGWKIAKIGRGIFDRPRRLLGVHPDSGRLLLSAESVFDGFHEIHFSVRDTIIRHIKRMLLKCAHVDDSVVARSIIIAA